MKIGDFKLWRSAPVCWAFSVLFFVLTLAFQVVTVKPYPEMERDLLFLTVGCGSAAVLSLVLAIRAARRKRRSSA
jgi:hypothetical protein